MLADDDVVAANVLPLGGRVFLAAGNPQATAALRSAGEQAVELDLDEFTKADGGPTCLVVPRVLGRRSTASSPLGQGDFVV